MRIAWSLGASAVLLSQTVFVLGAQAATFPDVSANNPYGTAIRALADQQVIKGNDDGTFAPDRTVNRAEFLTMLYRAKGINPSAPTAPCFKDIPVSAWFAAVVCDAATNTYVSGYADKTFKPEQAVNRVEALKMMFTVLGLNQKGSLGGTTKALAYPDVVASAWYMQYLSAAFTLNILPVPGVSSTSFGPDQALSRAEAAAYIYNSISSMPLSLNGSSASSQMMQTSSARSTSSASSSQKSLATEAVGTINTVNFPFSDNGAFTKKLAHSYQFTLTQKMTVSFQATLINENQQSDLTCRVYKLDGNSFSLEYYLGNENLDSCTVVATLTAGSYQFDMQPTVPDSNFTLTTKTVQGDGNDGFIEAKNLVPNIPVSTVLDTNDLSDFYTFSLKDDTNMTIQLTNAENLKCVIYPMENVDIYGFSEPNCNALYDFPAGTYYVGVMQKDRHNSKQNYSIQYNK
jgi:hypothetical protein